ncbi:hypothetical protein AB1I63_07480 [Streptococcus pneumoniae]
MDRKFNKITIVHVGDFMGYPPVLNLVENLLCNGYSVQLVSMTNCEKIPQKLIQNENFKYIKSTLPLSGGLVPKLRRVISEKNKLKSVVENCMLDSDILWTTTDLTVKILGNMLFKYRHVMQLMELKERMPLFFNSKRFDFPLSIYAQKAWKVVVPDLDRAYIQQVWWDLPVVPTVLPNKPYSVDYGQLSSEIMDIIQRMKEGEKKIIFYLGAIGPDRDLETFAEAIQRKENYCLYIAGKDISGGAYLDRILEKFSNIVYLGFFSAPQHLALLEHAHIGLTPYIPEKNSDNSELNALYCAPNKIYEYSAFGIPMIGTNVLGLKRPFEQYNIGRCCEDMTEGSILASLDDIEKNYDEMRSNCFKFYQKDDLDNIVREIIEG